MSEEEVAQAPPEEQKEEVAKEGDVLPEAISQMNAKIDALAAEFHDFISSFKGSESAAGESVEELKSEDEKECAKSAAENANLRKMAEAEIKKSIAGVTDAPGNPHVDSPVPRPKDLAKMTAREIEALYPRSG